MSYFKHDSLEEALRLEAISSDLSPVEIIQALLKVIEYITYEIKEEEKP